MSFGVASGTSGELRQKLGMFSDLRFTKQRRLKGAANIFWGKKDSVTTIPQPRECVIADWDDRHEMNMLV